jgi:hypothetical protein
MIFRKNNRNFFAQAIIRAHPQMADSPDIGVREKFYPRDINPVPAVKFSAAASRKIILFVDGH